MTHLGKSGRRRVKAEIAKIVATETLDAQYEYDVDTRDHPDADLPGSMVFLYWCQPYAATVLT